MTYSVEGEPVAWSDQEALPPNDTDKDQKVNEVFNRVPWTRRRRVVNGNRERSRDMKHVLAAAAMLVAALAVAGIASAQRGRTGSSSNHFPRAMRSRSIAPIGDFDFSDRVEGDIKVRVTDVVATDGALLQTIFQSSSKRRTRTRSRARACGSTGAANEVWDYASNTRTITGAVFVGNGPGGKRVQDTGRITMTLDTRIASFVAGPHEAFLRRRTRPHRLPRRSPKPETQRDPRREGVSMDTKRLVPLSGIAFVTLIVLSLAVGGGTPASGASADEVASFYGDDLARQFVSTFVLAALAPPVVLFGVGLASSMSPGTGWSIAWRHVVLAGATLVAGTVLLSAFVHMAIVDGGDQGISPTALQALNALDGNTWIAFTSGLGVLLLGSAGAMLSAGSRRVLGWSALVLGVALFLPFVDFIAMLASALWIVVVSVAIARGRETDEAAVDGMAVPTGA